MGADSTCKKNILHANQELNSLHLKYFFDSWFLQSILWFNEKTICSYLSHFLIVIGTQAELTAASAKYLVSLACEADSSVKIDKMRKGRHAPFFTLSISFAD